MTSIRGNILDVLEAIPESIPILEPPRGGPTIASPARSGSFMVEGTYALAVAPQRGGVTSVTIHGSRVLSSLAAHVGTASHITLHPGVARRELTSPNGSCVETIVVAPTLPFVGIQWGTERGTVPELIDIELRGDPLATGVRANSRGLAFALPGGHVGAMGTSPSPHALEIKEVDAGRIHVVLRPAASEPFSLVLSAGQPEAVRAAFAASLHLPGHAMRAASGFLEGGLTLATGVAEVDDGVAWARTRLHGLLTRVSPEGAHNVDNAIHAPLPSVFVGGLATMGVGDREGARRALGARSIVGSPSGALLAAHFAAAFGDTSHALEYARTWLEADPSPGNFAAVAAGGLDALAYHMLADALQNGGPESTIVALRERAAALQEKTRNSALEEGLATTERRLPVVARRADDAPWAAWLPTLLGGEPDLPVPSCATAEIKVIRRAGATFRTDPDSAWSDWTRTLSAGLVQGPAGPGTWDAVPSLTTREPGYLAGEVLLALAHGLLGIHTDAPAGRLSLAPRLPSQLTKFAAHGITLGKTSLRMGYTRSGGVHQFTLEPEVSSVPPILVFAPSVQGPVEEVRVDGEVANLDLRRVGSLTTVPVQIPIDGPRSIEIFTS